MSLMEENGLLFPIIFIIASTVILYLGADWSLNASEEIGERLGMPKLLVGLLLVGLGTSLPEFFVSHLAYFRGKPEMAIGNIIGSNLGNLFFILGLAGVLTPLSFKSESIKKQAINHFILSILVLIVFQTSTFGPISSAILILLFICFLYQLYREKINLGVSKEDRSHLTQLDMINRLGLFFRLIGGFTLLYIGGELLVNGGIKMGKYFNVSDYLISVVLFSFATSFPELVTTIVACLKKKDFPVYLLGAHSTEQDLRKEYSKMKTNRPAFYADQETKDFFKIEGEGTPEIFIYYQQTRKRHLGFLPCSVILKNLQSIVRT